MYRHQGELESSRCFRFGEEKAGELEGYID